MSDLYINAEGLLCLNFGRVVFKVVAVSEYEDGAKFRVEFLRFTRETAK